MKLQGKLAIAIGLVALLASCQKEEMPLPGNCDDQIILDGSNSRHDNPNGPNDYDAGDEPVSDSIVGGGDDDRDGGGVVGGGDADRDGGRWQKDPDLPK